MRIYKETSSGKFIKIPEKDFNNIISDMELLYSRLHSYCTSDKAYRNMSDVVNKEGR